MQSYMAGSICTLLVDHEGFHETHCKWCDADLNENPCDCDEFVNVDDEFDPDFTKEELVDFKNAISTKMKDTLTVQGSILPSKVKVLVTKVGGQGKPHILVPKGFTTTMKIIDYVEDQIKEYPEGNDEKPLWI